MTSTVLYTILSLSFIGVSAASLLYIIAQKFKVYEDPQIEEVDEILPGANCGGCGSPGCKPFAEQLVQSDDISEMFCPVGGNDVMGQIAELLGKVVKEQDPQEFLDNFNWHKYTTLRNLSEDKIKGNLSK